MTILMFKVTVFVGCAWLLSECVVRLYLNGISTFEKLRIQTCLSAKDLASRFPIVFVLSLVCTLAKAATILLATATSVVWLAGL